jgi:hypothetical protein
VSCAKALDAVTQTTASSTIIELRNIGPPFPIGIFRSSLIVSGGNVATVRHCDKESPSSEKEHTQTLILARSSLTLAIISSRTAVRTASVANFNRSLIASRTRPMAWTYSRAHSNTVYASPRSPYRE